ncbi:MAG TPA: lytic transglycosylase domain-containing protein [Flavobacterium sp.]|nr:lytic transglycosylase domain-containing protein [Flavobacterium sp.]
MILKCQYSLTAGLFLFFFTAEIYAQELPAAEVSKEKQEYYHAVLERNKAVVAFIENTLIENRLPKMLRNLSLIESGFDKNSVSAASAGGLWQFMPAHAAQYGLKSEGRFDIYHSTQAAMKSLKNLYGKYGNWITVVAAYNCGEGNISKAMEKANSDRYDAFYVYLPSETISHVYKFMQACKSTGELELLLADYRLSQFQPENPIREKPALKNPMLASAAINGAFDLGVIAEEMKIKRSDLDRWNPGIEKELIKEGVAVLYLPIDKMPDFQLLKNTILNRSLQTATNND